MTDARLPGPWLHRVAFDELDDMTWRVFTRALMWCAEQGTDGFVPRRYLVQLHPDGEQPASFDVLVQAGLWERTPNGYQLIDWDGELGQSTAEQVATQRANARERQRKYRQRELEKKQAETARSITKRLGEDPAMGNATSDVTRDVGKGIGEGEGSDEEPVWNVRQPPVDAATGEVHEGWVDPYEPF